MTISTSEPITPSTATALRELGVSGNERSAEGRRQLDDEGVLVLPGVIDTEWLEELRQHTDELLAHEGVNAGHELGGCHGDHLG